jgi:hypothetical protein
MPTSVDTSEPPTPYRPRWAMIAAVALAMAGAASAFTYVWNYDVFWHLASGDWMLTHGRVLGFDPFSIDGQPRWVNVHWLFQVIVSSLHAVGGMEALSVLKAVLGGAAGLILAVGLRRRAPTPWLILCGLLMIVVMQERMRIRPEAFSLPLMLLTILAIESVRTGGSPRRLWVFVPLLLFWVNLHGLYILGPALLWSSVAAAGVDYRLGRVELAGPLPSRRVLIPLLAATAACFATPWPLEVAAQPLLLWTRISGEIQQFTTGVWEFEPTWLVWDQYRTAIVLTVLTTAAMIANLRRVPLAHWLWLGVFAVLAVRARRNVSLLGPVYGYLLAVHGADTIAQIARRAPRLARGGAALRTAAVAAALLVAAGYATEWMHQIEGSACRFGAALQRELYPIDTARRLAELPGEGGIYCENFGDAGTFMYHTWPRRQTYMDGRLEAHPAERFAEQVRIRRAITSPAGSDNVALPETVRFLVVRCDHGRQLEALSQSGRFRLVFVEPAAATFERTDLSADASTADALSRLDRPLLGNGQVRDMPVEPRRWTRANPRPINYNTGQMLLRLGRPAAAGLSTPLQRRCTLLAVRYLTAAAGEPRISRATRTGMQAWAWRQFAQQTPATPTPGRPIDLHSARSLHLYEQLDLRDLSDSDTREFAMQRFYALLHDRQLDAALQAMQDLLAALTPEGQAALPTEFLAQAHAVGTRAMAMRAPGVAYPPQMPHRARTLADETTGMIDWAIEECRTVDDPASTLLLGDLLLRKGLPDQARDIYRKLTPSEERRWTVEMRLALCNWVGGKFHEAVDAMEPLIRKGNREPARYYLAVMREVLGQS